jgi:glycine/D-amino acid oxidase-like deaminating enzyme
MGPKVDVVETDTVLPERCDVVVIGGGIIGVSTALALAQKGVSVTLCEKGHIAGEQSSRNWGWVRKTARDEREIPLILESLRMWDGMNDVVGAETGFRKCGILFAARTDADLAQQEDWLRRAAPYQIGARMIDAAEVERLIPGGTVTFKGGLYTPSDGRAEPQKAAPAIAAAARRLGATVLAQCAVRGLDIAAGRVTGVVTELGRIACDAVVLAGGAWSRLFAGSLGLRLPQLKVLSSVMRTAPLQGLPETSAWIGDVAFRKRLDGGYSIANGHGNVVPIVPDTFQFMREFLPALRADWKALRPRLNGRFLTEARTPKRWSLDEASPFEAVRTLDPAPDAGINARVEAKLKVAFPGFSGMKVEQHWAGLIDVTPDAVPVISNVDSLPGLIIATGFSGHGFGIGPAAGRLAADLATGAPPIVDPTPFRFSRFSDGSPIVVEAGL